MDPLYIANEGKMVAIVAAEDSENILAAMRKNKYGKNAAVIGEVGSGKPGRVTVKTVMGASRIVDMLSGDPLPRIC
jgi:hydrogenase expression/formation protein HypE